VKRKQFTFYESFFDAIMRIKSKTAQRDAFVVLCEYALKGETPNLDKLPDSVAIAFELARPTLDASRRKAENGKKGGSKKQTEANSKQNEANCKQTASKGEKEEENEKENEIEIEIKNKVENECIKADFALFWEAYPRKEGMQKAEEAFAKVVVPVQDLLDAIEAQKKSPQWKKDNGVYIPHPAKWLDEKRWLDQTIMGTPNGAKGELGEEELSAISKLMRGGDST
jgi:hypothetical protein